MTEISNMSLVHAICTLYSQITCTSRTIKSEIPRGTKLKCVQTSWFNIATKSQIKTNSTNVLFLGVFSKSNCCQSLLQTNKAKEISYAWLQIIEFISKHPTPYNNATRLNCVSILKCNKEQILYILSDPSKHEMQINSNNFSNTMSVNQTSPSEYLTKCVLMIQHQHQLNLPCIQWIY